MGARKRPFQKAETPVLDVEYICILDVCCSAIAEASLWLYMQEALT